MYAKLVIGGTNQHSQRAIKDIVRLLTSANPNTASLLSFSNTASVIVDNTPAGWTYVGSNDPRDAAALTGNTVANNFAQTQQPLTNVVNYVCSSPALQGTGVKYAVFNSAHQNTSISYLAYLTGATAATANGVLTNEGPRYVANNLAVPDISILRNSAFACGLANAVIHVIANQRHITIVEEGQGISALWESSFTDPHYFYNIAPVIQYAHANSANYLFDPRTTPATPVVNGTNLANTIFGATFGLTDPNVGTSIGTYDPFQNGVQNLFYLMQVANTFPRNNSVSNTGVSRYNLTTSFYTMPQIGYPTSFITGTVPLYWTKGAIGATGDTAIVNGVTYTLFNAGTGFSVLMTTAN
jgi:hypothetical protein